MDLQLKGKTALVTGSSAGIGEAIAKCLAQEGVRVMVHGRRENELKRVVQEIVEAGGKADFVQGDLSKDGDATHVAEKTLKVFKNLDILVNNAGIFPPGSWLEGEPAAWLELFNTNVVSMVRLIKILVPQMRVRGWGRVFQIASVAGIHPAPTLPEYGVTKAANINMTISLAKELKGSGITVNSISPGPIVTPGVKERFKERAKEFEWGDTWEEIEKRAAREVLPTLAGRFGKPEEVGALVTFLSSPLADFITGANYVIDGGRML